MKLVILPNIRYFTKIGTFTLTLEPLTLGSRSKAQRSRILA